MISFAFTARHTLAAVAFSVMLGGTSWAADADAIFPLVPARSDIVVDINVRKLLDTPAIRQALTSPQCEKITRKIDAIGSFTHMDPMKDINRVAFFGLVDDKNYTAFCLQGHFDSDQIIKLLKMNDSYATAAIGATTVHRWHDSGEDRDKWGVFVGTVAVIANSEQVMKDILDTYTDHAKSLEAAAGSKTAQIPANAADAAIWALLPRLDREPHQDNEGPIFGVQGIAARGEIEGNQIIGELSLTMESEADAAEMHKVLEGAIALGKLPNSKAPWTAQIAQHAQVSEAKGTSARVKADVPIDSALKILTNLVCR